MPTTKRIADCLEAARACAERDPHGGPRALERALRGWVRAQRGTKVFVADSDDFRSQFGDDRQGAYDMEDQMNAIAATTRDNMLELVLDAFDGAAPDDTVVSRIETALAAVATVHYGYYDKIAVVRSLYDLALSFSEAGETA